MSGDVAGRALSCIGTPFRLYGRTPGVALDCAGLAGFAAGLSDLPRDYTMYGDFLRTVKSHLAKYGKFEVPAGRQIQSGEIALVQCGPRQQHLMVRVQDGWVHAHAGLGRVVHMAGLSPWPVLAVWKISSQNYGE